MQALRIKTSRIGLAGLAFAAVLNFAAVSQAEIVANLGTLPIGVSEVVSCNTLPSCTTTTGTSGGQLPANTPGADPFSHQIIFRVAQTSDTIASTQVLDNTSIDVANMTVQLFELAGGSATAVGATATLGALLATALSNTFFTTTNFFLTYAGLDPAKTYAIQITGAGQGVQKANASYAETISIVAPVPLPPALMLFAAAIAGLIGFARVRRNRAIA